MARDLGHGCRGFWKGGGVEILGLASAGWQRDEVPGGVPKERLTD